MLRLHPQVDDAAVCGHYIPEQATDIPIAFITTRVPKDQHPTLFEDVIQFVRKRVASYKRIYEVRVVEEIPRNAGGKIVRRQLEYRRINIQLSSRMSYNLFESEWHHTKEFMK